MESPSLDGSKREMAPEYTRVEGIPVQPANKSVPDSGAGLDKRDYGGMVVGNEDGNVEEDLLGDGQEGQGVEEHDGRLGRFSSWLRSMSTFE